MIGVIRKVKKNGKLVDGYFIDGKQVSKKKFDKLMEQSIPKKNRNRFNVVGKKRNAHWPMASDAMAVNRNHLKKALARDKANGAPPTEYDKAGRPIWTSERHKRAYNKALGVHDNNAYYSND